MVGVQFMDYTEEQTSRVYGPYDSVQITYDTLVVGEDMELAAFDVDLAGWLTQDGVRYSDFVVAPWDSDWVVPDAPGR
jgi:hypothetical protein